MAIQELVNLQLTICLLVSVGLFLKKFDIITESGRDSLTDLVIYVLLPCNIIKAFSVSFDRSILFNFGVMLIISIIIQIGSSMMGKVLYVRQKSNKRKVLQYATVCSNAGFLGNPIAESIFGMMGLALASIFLIPQRIVMWSAGVAIFTESPDKKVIVKRVATHPCIVAVVIGLILMFSQLQLPVFLDTSIKSLSVCSTAISMIVIGTLLADVKFKTLINKTVIYYTVIRLILMPMIVWAGCIVFGVDTLVTGVAVILTAMPAGTTTGILAAKYGGDYIFAIKCIVFSTIASLVSIPIWTLLLK